MSAVPSTTQTAQANTSGRERFITVPLAVLSGLPNLNCDIYIQDANSKQKILYRAAGVELPIGEDETLKRRNVRHLFLRAEDRSLYQQAIETTEDVTVRLAKSTEKHRETFQTALLSRDAGKAVTASESVAVDVLKVVDQDDFPLHEAIGLLDHDQCTFQHSCNVSIYSATIARKLGVGEEDLKLITMGAILHDIGKRHIPGFILRKPGKLDDHERALIRQHPTTGFRELAALKQLSWAQLMMAYQHHEWINGNGYPAGARGTEIHLWARICSVADVFDALTANRPYRDSDGVDRALGIMTKETGHFDEELFQLWTEIVK